MARSGDLGGAGRRFVLVLVATVIGLSGVLAAYFYAQQREYNRFSFQNIVWEGAQIRNEHQAFRAALLELLIGAAGASPEEVQRRYDILYGRLTLLGESRAAETYNAEPMLRQLLARIDPEVRAWEAPLASFLREGRRDSGEAVAEAARRLDPDFSAFASDVNMIGMKRIDEARQRLNRLYNILIGVAALTWMLVFGFAFVLMRQLRETESAHAELAGLTSDLEQARRLAEEANRAKSNFLATMSHELRTPLNAIIGFADIMRQRLFGPVGSDRYTGYIEGIVTSGEHLLALINDVLDMSRIEAGRLELAEEDVRLDLAIEEAAALVAVTADSKGIQLRRAVPAGLPAIHADPRVLRQMLLNLLSNAIKFTPEGGQVEVAAALLSDGDVAIRVRDTGIGMSDAQLHRVFEPFSHDDSMRAREMGGTGLGLPITRRLIELHGGRIQLASRKSAGTTATLIFPAARTRPLAGAA
ncbi:sensor histidine kinase [Ferrovibrio sp.]|uniref:sensor histidine kinase n=1 Tax=Ferrovibrio sp. TaxID=1917215 RepID=UPI003517B9F5